MFTLASPPMQSGVIPLATALVAIGLIRLIGGPGRGGRVAGLGLALGILASYWAIFRIPDFPPVGATNKLFYSALAATVAGLAVDLLRAGRGPGRALALIAGPLAAAWIGGANGLDAPWPDGAAVAAVAVLTAAAGWALSAGDDHSALPAALLLVLVLALGAAAFLANTASSAQLAVGMGAATGGFLIWNWPRARFRFGASALVPLLALIGGLATQFALFMPKLEIVALLPLVAVPFLVPVIKRLVPGTGTVREGLGTAATVAIAAIPAGLALLLVHLAVPETQGYAY